MTRRTIQAQGREYLFSPDDPVPYSRRMWAIVQGRLINDVTNGPVTSFVQLKSDVKECSARIFSDGLVGLAGIPGRVFPVLAGKNFTMTVDVIADGYLPRTLTVSIPNDQRTTIPPLPQKGDRILALDSTARLLAGETLMVGNPITNPGTHFEEVQIAMLGPGASEVTITPPFAEDHNMGTEPVVPVVADNFSPVNLGDIRMVPAP